MNKVKQSTAYLPIKEDNEAKTFLEDTPDNQLLDKIIHREIYQVDEAQ